MQVLGVVRVLDPGDAEVGLDALTRKYDQYRSSPPPGPVLALEPAQCLFWRAAESA